MTIPDEDRALQRLAAENKRLQDRVVELESELGRLEGGQAQGQVEATTRKFVKLIQAKDQTLSKYAEELEEKQEALEKTLAEVQEKNRELTNSLAAIRFFQDILANDPAIIVGFDADRNIAHFNSSAEQFFGAALAGMLFQPAAALPCEELQPRLGALLDEVLEKGELRGGPLRARGADYHLAVFPLRSAEGIRGAVLRLVRIEG